MFSVVYGVLLRPLPYRDAARLVVVRMERTVDGMARPVRSFFPLTDLAELRVRTRSFDAIAFYSTEESVLWHNGFGEHVKAASVSPEFFAAVGGAFRSGRGLAAADESAVVISDRLRRRVFGEQEAIGGSVRLGTRAYAIVGVADTTFQIPTSDTDVWYPAVQTACCPYVAIGRLRFAVPPSQAATDVGSVLPLLAEKSPRVYSGARASVTTMHQELVGNVQRPLWVLLASVGLLLAVSCANATTLLIGRNMARARETSIRIAIGASRGRLMSQSLADAVIVVVMAGCLGMLIAAALVDALVWLHPAGIPRVDAGSLRIDRAAFFFSAAIAAVSTIVMGLLPALGGARTLDSIRIDAPGVSPGRASGRMHDALVTVQLAVSLMLLIGAALLGRSFERLVTSDLGVRPDHVATAAINLSHDRRLADEQQSAVTDAILDRVRALPAVQAVGAGAALPPHASTIRLTLKRFGDTVDYEAAGVPATPGYFPALGVRLLKGRFFTDADGAAQPPVMIMTSDTARRFFGDGDPIGRTMTLPVLRNGTAGSEEVTLVGVISNIKYSGLEAAPDDAVYRPLRQQAWPLLFVVARTTADPAVLTSMLRREIAAVDPAVTVSAVNTLDEIVASDAAQPRFRSAVLAGLAVFALAIASVGLYGVVAQRTSLRRKEFGVRTALGAGRVDLLMLVFGQGARLAIMGLVVGIGASLLATRLMRSLLYGLEPTDGLSFAVASGLLLLVAAAASYIPARRAAHVDAVIALRSE
jgi:predicted permease